MVQLEEWSNIWCVLSRLLYALLYQLLYYGLSRCYKSKSEKLLFEQQIKAGQRQFVVVIHIRHGKTSRIYGKADVEVMDSNLCENGQYDNVHSPNMTDRS